MSDNSSIEWTEATWNPTTGCTKVSAGCDNCYAETLHERFHGKGSFAIVSRSEEKLYAPLKWKRPRRIFVNSMSDLFHDDVPDSFIARAFSIMANTPRHTYQLLTKRHARMRSLLSKSSFRDNLLDLTPGATWPLPNVWLGVSVENQQWADIRIPALLATPAAVRWLSMEPLLGPVNLNNTWLHCGHESHTGTGSPAIWACDGCGEVHREVEDPSGPNYVTQVNPPRQYRARTEALTGGRLIDWVVVGGESGPKARPMHPRWARDLRDQCTDARVPFFFKQWGAWAPNGWRGIGNVNPRERLVGEPVDDLGHREVIERTSKKAAGRELDGRTWDEYPATASVPA